jgi:hypothetical protein
MSIYVCLTQLEFLSYSYSFKINVNKNNDNNNEIFFREREKLVRKFPPRPGFEPNTSGLIVPQGWFFLPVSSPHVMGRSFGLSRSGENALPVTSHSGGG